MRTGIDLSALQSPHKMRGIGSALINFVNNIPLQDRKNNFFVFFMFQCSDHDNPLIDLNLKDLDFEVRYFNESIVTNKTPVNSGGLFYFLKRVKRLVGRKSKKIISCVPKKLCKLFTANLKLVKNIVYILRPYDPLIKHVKTNDLDIFIEFDPDKKVTNTKIKYACMLHDIIPYVLEWDYLLSYKTARKKSYSRKSSINKHVHRLLYIKKIRMNACRSEILLSNSNTTKNDFVKYAGIKENRITVTHLGINESSLNANKTVPLHCYMDTAWGIIKKDLLIEKNTMFLLYVGGVDTRRKLEDLIVAFNMLRAQKYKVKLILAGDIMYSPGTITNKKLSESLKSSSYLKDIIFMGFINNKQRDWLYKNALAFVFPSRYEGFGLPILEAMIQKCPVIGYPNKAAKEIATDNILYARSPADIYSSVINLIKLSDAEKKEITEKGFVQAQKYNWSKTAHHIINTIEKSLT